MENEIWRDIIGLKGLYQVSNMGRVKSKGRNVNLSSGKVRKLKDITRNKFIGLSECSAQSRYTLPDF